MEETLNHSGIRTSRGVLILTLASLVGCATNTRLLPPPNVQTVSTIKVSSADSEQWSDGILGLHRIPGSQVFMSCHEGSIAAILLLGPLGMAANAAASKQALSERVGDSEAGLKLRIDAKLASLVDDAIASEKLEKQFSRKPAEGSSTLSITPAIALCAFSEDQVQPFVVLQTELLAADGSSLWQTRLVGATGEPRPLAGPGSWTSDDGAALKASVSQSAEQLVRVLFTDIARPYKRDDAAQTLVETPLPYMRKRMRVASYVLEDNDRYLAFVSRGTHIYSGTFVMDKRVVSYRPLQPKDPLVDVVNPRPSPRAAAPAPN